MAVSQSTLDIEMPGLTGLEVLERVMKQDPLPIVMVSTKTQEGAEMTFEALELGAVDYIAKPLAGMETSLQSFQEKVVRAVETAFTASPDRKTAGCKPAVEHVRFTTRPADTILVGTRCCPKKPRLQCTADLGDAELLSGTLQTSTSSSRASGSPLPALRTKYRCFSSIRDGSIRSADYANIGGVNARRLPVAKRRRICHGEHRTMDVRYINPFVKSICNVFETMCSLKVTVGKPGLKTNHLPLTDVSSVIGFSGDAAGSVVLDLSFDVASKIASVFTGTEITPQHPDFADALGELANMIAGGAKCQFEGLNISISLPNVIVGHNHNVSASKVTPRIVIPCTTDVGTFHVEVGMVLANKQPAAGVQTAVAGAKA